MSSTIKNNFKNLYRTKIRPLLQSELKYSSIMQVPVLEKIVINMGIGDATVDSKRLDSGIEELSLITGQKPVITRAKNSIANFKLREGQGIGTKVTLRGNRMYSFLERLIKVALPNVRDFRGLKRTAFDQFGNYTLGIKEQIVFPEINFDHVQKIRGMDITIVTSAVNREAAYALLNAFGMPFQKAKGIN